MADLLINGQDALRIYGLRMGDGFLDEIDTEAPSKELVENKSRLEHGKRIDTSNMKVDERDLTLAFTITGTSEADFRNKKKAFFTALRNGIINISVPSLGDNVYRLIYQKHVSYGMSRNRCFSHLAIKFNEPNPMNRGTEE